FTPVKTEKTSTPPVAANLPDGVRVRLEHNSEKFEQWVPAGWEITVPTSPKETMIAYGWKVIGLPIGLELLDFEVKRNEGSDSPALTRKCSRVESWCRTLNVCSHMGNRRVIQSIAFFGFMAALAVCASDDEQAEVSGDERSVLVESKWGSFNGEPVTKWNPDGRTMTLLTELRYTDPQGFVWLAPIGSVVDGASIPRYMWSIMGGPFEGKYRNASVLHDVAYGDHNRPWQDCDRMFYYAMRCSGVSAIEAKTMFYALYRFGHHWKFSIRSAKPVKYEGDLVAQGEEIPRAIAVNPAEVSEAREWISDSDPTLEQIEQRADAEGY